MKNLVIAVILIFLLSCNQSNIMRLNYPVTKKVDTVDNYFGTKVPDPYRWLEDDKSAETAEWVKAQNAVTFKYLDSIPFRKNIKERLTKIWNYAKIGIPFKKGDRYFYFKNDGLQNQSVMYILDNLKSEPRLFFDPNTLSKDGTVALGATSFSKDGNYMAYSIASAGSDWNEIHVKNVKSGEILKDKIEWVKFSGIAWHKDGFFYSRYDKPSGSALSKKNEFHKVFYHKIGTDQANDVLIYENKKFPLRNYGAGTSEDEKYLYMAETESTSGNSLYVKDLSKANDSFKLIAPDFKDDYNVVDVIDGKLIVLTNNQAPKFKLIAIDLDKPEKENWKDLIPMKDDVLESCSFVGGKLIALYMKDVHSVLQVFDKNGKYEHDVELPTVGTVSGFNGESKSNEAFYSFTSYTVPTMIFRYDIAKNKSEVYFKPGVDFDGSQYEVKQVFYTSKDGTKIPMDLVYNKGIRLDGNNPVFIYGYGGFNITYKPNFSVGRIIWLENGGIYVNTHIRGGGEYGEDWHLAGTKLKKQNVFDDFIGAAEYLIKEKYTSPEKIAIQGGSNGGLLVGAVVNQRPDLFRVALPAVGVMDMLRYHKFTIGWAWATDYGTSDSLNHFQNLIKYSPIHTIKENVEYPAIMVTTADHDDRVVPAHSFKYISAIQEKYKGPNPVIIRIETSAGHGAGKPTSKTIEETADMFSFVFFNMNLNPKY